MSKSRALIRGDWLWVAWYPARGLRSQVEWKRDEYDGGRFFVVALGPMYLKLGYGVPSP